MEDKEHRDSDDLTYRPPGQETAPQRFAGLNALIGGVICIAAGSALLVWGIFAHFNLLLPVLIVVAGIAAIVLAQVGRRRRRERRLKP